MGGGGRTESGERRGKEEWGEWEMGGGKHNGEQREEVLFLADKK